MKEIHINELLIIQEQNNTLFHNSHSIYQDMHSYYLHRSFKISTITALYNSLFFCGYQTTNLLNTKKHNTTPATKIIISFNILIQKLTRRNQAHFYQKN